MILSLFWLGWLISWVKLCNLFIFLVPEKYWCNNSHSSFTVVTCCIERAIFQSMQLTIWEISLLSLANRSLASLSPLGHNLIRCSSLPSPPILILTRKCHSTKLDSSPASIISINFWCEDTTSTLLGPSSDAITKKHCTILINQNSTTTKYTLTPSTTSIMLRQSTWNHPNHFS